MLWFGWDGRLFPENFEKSTRMSAISDKEHNLTELGMLRCSFCRFCSTALHTTVNNLRNENYDIAIAMSSSCADPELGHCPGWGYLSINQCHCRETTILGKEQSLSCRVELLLKL